MKINAKFKIETLKKRIESEVTSLQSMLHALNKAIENEVSDEELKEVYENVTEKLRGIPSKSDYDLNEEVRKMFFTAAEKLSKSLEEKIKRDFED